MSSNLYSVDLQISNVVVAVFYGLGGLPSDVKFLFVKELICIEFVKVRSKIFNHFKGPVK